MTAYADVRNYYTFLMDFTTGSSETAEYVSKSMEKIRLRFYESFILGLQVKGLLDELDEVATECKRPGWDGYDALPVQAITVEYAYQFLLALPPAISTPSIGSEPDGCITFEWYHSKHRVFSISISPDGYIHYAYLNGNTKKHGSEPFSGSLSKEIVSYITDMVD